MVTPAQQSPSSGRASALKERLRLLIQDYGPVALGVFVALWIGTLAAVYTAVSMGWRPDSAAEQAGTFATAYLIFRFTLPVRIAATLVLTPLVAMVLAKLGLRKPKAEVREPPLG